MSAWTTQEEYEARHGTQEEQSKAQVYLRASTGGPWRLERAEHRHDAKTDSMHLKTLVLPNSVRSTMAEAVRLMDDEYVRTGIRWGIVRFERGEKC
jgi:hypothetical protein